MRFSDDQTDYRLACQLYRQGIECDLAAQAIRQLMPELIERVVAQVKERSGPGYTQSKEQDVVAHLHHGENGQECECTGGKEERWCAWQGCDACQASVNLKDQEP